MSESCSFEGRPSAAKETAPAFKTKPFGQLFDRDELIYYGVAAVVYILLGLLLRDIVLNWIVGPVFITVWMWQVPPLAEKWKERRS